MLAVLMIALAVASPQAVAIRRLADQDLRVATIGYRLARASSELCPGQIAPSGLVLQDAAQYAPEDRGAAREALGLADAVTVVGVVKGSAAEAAELRDGARIVAVGGAPVDASVAHDGYARVAQAEDALERALRGGDAVVTGRLQDRTVTVRLHPQPGCSSRFQIVPGRALNAKADGRYIQIDGAMVDFAGTDADLAVVIAHELAHNVLRHKALHMRSQEAEYQADRLGVWLMARAGYDVSAVVPFWTRLGQRTGLGILSDGSHPRWRARVAAVAAAVKAVKAQQAAHQPLIPSPQ